MTQYGIPEVFESEVYGIMKNTYEDIKYVLKVPVVNFIFRALALYPEFLSCAWQQVRPNMLTVNMELAANQLRFPSINTKVPSYDFSKDYQPSTLQYINRVISTFQYVNPKLLLIASAWAESLGNRPITPKKEILGHIQPGIYQGFPQIEMVHIPHAPYYLQQLLLDITKEHHSYDVASDFRTLARFPRFLEVAWHYLKKYIDQDEYSILKSKLLNQAVSTVHQDMPYPVNCAHIAKIYSPSQIAGIMGLVSFFQSFLPGLIVEVEFMRRMLYNSDK